MAERPGWPQRRIGMRLRAVGMLLALPLLVTGCGDGDPVVDDGHGQFALPGGCAPTPTGAAEVARVDLDGDGTADQIRYTPPTDSCGSLLSAAVGGRQVSVTLEGDLPAPAATSFAISVPGRKGDLAVVRQEHPRGGFQISIVGWDAGHLALLESGGKPIFPFVATDSLSTPLTATCTDGGFEVTQAQAHQPIGVAPAWDVVRTTYTLDANTVTQGGTTKVADNVLDAELRAKYADLVRHRLFENCRAGS